MGFYGRITLPRQQESGKAVCRIVQNPSEDNGKAAKEYREPQESQRIAEGFGECQVTKRRKREEENTIEIEIEME